MKCMVFFRWRRVPITEIFNCGNWQRRWTLENCNLLDHNDLQGNCSVGDLWRFHIY